MPGLRAESFLPHRHDGVSLLWFQDAKGGDIGVPLERIAFIELVESPDKAVGFGR